MARWGEGGVFSLRPNGFVAERVGFPTTINFEPDCSSFTLYFPDLKKQTRGHGGVRLPAAAIFEKFHREATQLAKSSEITKISRVRGSGTFKRRTRLNKQGGKDVVYWEGYVYGSDGKKCYGSGDSLRRAEMAAIVNRNNYEQRIVRLAREVITAAQTAMESVSFREAALRVIRRKAGSYGTRRKYLGFVNVLSNEQYAISAGDQGHIAIGSLPMSNITLENLEDFVDNYRVFWTENSTYNLQSFIRQVFKYGSKKRWVHENLALDLDPRQKTPKVRYPIPDEVMQRLIQLCDHPQLKAFLLLSTYALRSGEAAGLIKRSVVAPNTFMIQYTQAWMENDLRAGKADAPKATLGLSQPKSNNANRLIEIPSEDWWILENSWDLANDTSVLTFDLGRSNEQFMMPNANGGQWRTDHIRRRLRRFLERLSDSEVMIWGANLPHTWRTSVITNLIDDEEDGTPGANLARVSRFAGHSRIEVTSNVYYKSTKRAQLEMSRKVSQKRRKLLARFESESLQ